MINVYNRNITIPYKGDIYLPQIVARCTKGGNEYYLAKCFDKGISFLVKKEGEYRKLLKAGDAYLVKVEYLKIKAL